MNVEFRIVEDSELPAIIITGGDNGTPKVVLNTYHKLWISLNRRIIAGITEALQEKMDEVLTSYLKEQYVFQEEERQYMGE